MRVAAMLNDSWKEPVPVAPSPKKTAVRFVVFLYFWAKAVPRAMRMPSPTTPFEPMQPVETSAKCMDPARPLQQPSIRPKSSAIMGFRSAPLAIMQPWPRWVVKMQSSRSRLAQVPAATASSPWERCKNPGISPPAKILVVSSSKVRCRIIRLYKSIFISLLSFIERPPLP